MNWPGPQAGRRIDIPYADELPELPEHIDRMLTRAREHSGGRGFDRGTDAWLDHYGAGSMTYGTRRTLDEALRELATGASRYDTMDRAVGRLVSMAARRHERGVAAALEELAERYCAAVAFDRDGDPMDEVPRSLHGAIEKFGAGR